MKLNKESELLTQFSKFRLFYNKLNHYEPHFYNMTNRHEKSNIINIIGRLLRTVEKKIMQSKIKYMDSKSNFTHLAQFSFFQLFRIKIKFRIKLKHVFFFAQQ